MVFFPYSLGSTRFFKVAKATHRFVFVYLSCTHTCTHTHTHARARTHTHAHTHTCSDGSEVVVKVFAKHDPLLQLAPYERKLHGTYIY